MIEILSNDFIDLARQLRFLLKFEEVALPEHIFPDKGNADPDGWHVHKIIVTTPR